MKHFFQDLKPFFNISKPSDNTKMPLCNIFLKTNRHIFQRKKEKKIQQERIIRKEQFLSFKIWKCHNYFISFEEQRKISFSKKMNTNKLKNQWFIETYIRLPPFSRCFQFRFLVFVWILTTSHYCEQVPPRHRVNSSLSVMHWWLHMSESK